MTQIQQGSIENRQNLVAALKLRFLQIIIILSLFIGGIGIIHQLIIGSEISSLLPLLGFITLMSGLWFASARKQYRTASMAMVLVYAALSFTPARPLLSVLAMLVAAIFAEDILYILSNGIILSPTIAAMLVIGNESGQIPSNEIFLFFNLIFVSIIVRYIITQIEGVARQATHANLLLTSSVSIGQELPRQSKLDKLLPRAVELIRARFNYYHVQIFLIDEDRQYAELKASTGEAGEKLLAIHHRLAVGSQSVIGQVSQTGEPIVARDTDAIHAFNELLPQTRAELALPMMDEDEVVGVLDVQSVDRDAFTPSEIQALQLMANQLTSILQNVRLFEAQQAVINENKRLLTESEINLREIRRLNRELMGEAWTEYIQQDRIISGVTLDESRFQPGAEWTENMETASQFRKPITIEQSDHRLLTVPIELRGEVLGAIEVEIDDEQSVKDSAEMLEAVAQRLAIGLENARLFEEIQASTAQEQQINEIVARYQSANTVEDLLQITLSELSMALGAKQGSIRLGVIQPGAQDNGDANL